MFISGVISNYQRVGFDKAVIRLRSSGRNKKSESEWLIDGGGDSLGLDYDAFLRLNRSTGKKYPSFSIEFDEEGWFNDSLTFCGSPCGLAGHIRKIA